MTHTMFVGHSEAATWKLRHVQCTEAPEALTQAVMHARRSRQAQTQRWMPRHWKLWRRAPHLWSSQGIRLWGSRWQM